MTAPDPRRQDLLAVLTRHRPRDTVERTSLAETLAALRALPRPFDVDADARHVTASGIVLDGRGRVLLHRHRRLGVWMQPGGHVDHGEQPADAVLREVTEETGLVARHLLPSPAPPVHVDAHDGGRGHRHYDLRYLLIAPAAPPRPPPGESPEVTWLTYPEARRRGDRSLVAALDAALAHGAASGRS